MSILLELILLLIFIFIWFRCELSSVIVEANPSIAESAMPSGNMPREQIIGIVGCNVVLVLINLSCLIWGLKLAKKDPEVEVTLK